MQNALRNRSAVGITGLLNCNGTGEMAMRLGRDRSLVVNGKDTPWRQTSDKDAGAHLVAERNFGRLSNLQITLPGSQLGQCVSALVYQPGRFSPAMPVCMVMHGVTRNAATYLESWVGLAERYEFILIVPEFPRMGWPTSREYNFGNVRTRDGNDLPRESWTFSAVETVFDAVRARFGLIAETYAIYGHSAGAQFVHRFILHTGGPRVARAVAANAGWYLVPDRRIAYPYGIADLPIDCRTLEAAFATPMTVLLGERDNDPDSPDLRMTRKARSQGMHRLARGQHFIEAATSIALNTELPFAWRMKTVPQVGHSDRAMAPFACYQMFAKPSEEP